MNLQLLFSAESANNNLKKFSKIIFFLLLFSPKFSIINLEGYSQGIRFDDFLILVVFIFIIILNKNKSVLSTNIEPLKVVVILLYIFSVSLLGSFLGVSQEWIVFVRLIEYLVFIYFLDTINLNLDFIKNCLVIFIITNTLISIPQHFLLVGGFASFGYLPAGHGWLERPYGLLGGPWELGASVSLSIFALRYLSCSKILLFFLNILVVTCLYLSDTRSNTFAYLICTIYIYRNIIFKPKILIILVLSVTIFYYYLWSDRYNAIGKLFYLIAQYTNGEIELIDVLNFETSIRNRLSVWIENFDIWKDNLYFILFGIGWHSLYMESFLLRLIFSFGLLGSALFFLLFRKVNKEIIIFTFISGLTLDLFLSFKIFLMYSIYAYIVKASNYKQVSKRLNYQNL